MPDSERVVPVEGVERVEACEVQVGDEVITDPYHRGVVCESKEVDVQEDRPGHWCLRLEGNPSFEMDRDAIVLRVVPVSSEPHQELGLPEGELLYRCESCGGLMSSTSEPECGVCGETMYAVEWPPRFSPARPVVEASGEREGLDEHAIALWRPSDQHPWREWESDKSDEVVGEMRDFVPLDLAASTRVPDEAADGDREAIIAALRILQDRSIGSPEANERTIDVLVGALGNPVTGAASRVPSAPGERPERWMVDYEHGDGEPQHTVLSWLDDEAKGLPDVGEYLIRESDAYLLAAPSSSAPGQVERGARALHALDEAEWDFDSPAFEYFRGVYESQAEAVLDAVSGPPATEGDPMPVFTIKAKDNLAIQAINGYRHCCLLRGLTDQAREVEKTIEEIEAWRTRNPDACKDPDHTHVPAGPPEPHERVFRGVGELEREGYIEPIDERGSDA